MELLLKLNGMHVLVHKCDTDDGYSDRWNSDGGSDGCVLTVVQMVVF